MSDNIPPVTPAAATPVQPAASRGYFNKEQLEDTALAESVLTAAKSNQATLATRDIDAAFLTRFGAITTNFPIGGYLMSVRMNKSRTLLLQCAADNLPGYKTAESIQVVTDLLSEYRGDQAAPPAKPLPSPSPAPSICETYPARPMSSGAHCCRPLPHKSEESDNPPLMFIPRFTKITIHLSCSRENENARTGNPPPLFPPSGHRLFQRTSLQKRLPRDKAIVHEQAYQIQKATLRQCFVKRLYHSSF